MVVASYGPITVELAHSTLGDLEATTYFSVSLKNGAPGSSSTVRVDHAGWNISNVLRPSRMALLSPVSAPIVSPIFGSKPNSNVHRGFSTTPSRLMNSCTVIFPMPYRPFPQEKLIGGPTSLSPHGSPSLDVPRHPVRETVVVLLLWTPP